MFSNYRVNRLSYEYAPALGSSAAGTLVGAFTMDPDDTFLANSYSSVVSLATRDGARSFPTYERTMIHMPKQGKLLYVPGSNHVVATEERFEYPGQFAIGCLVPPPIGVIGTLFVHYDVTFENENVLRTPSFNVSSFTSASGSGAMSWSKDLSYYDDFVSILLGTRTIPAAVGISNGPFPDPMGRQLRAEPVNAGLYQNFATVWPPGVYIVSTGFKLDATVTVSAVSNNLSIMRFPAVNVTPVDIVGTTVSGCQYTKQVNQCSYFGGTLDIFKEVGTLVINSTSTFRDHLGQLKPGALLSFKVLPGTSHSLTYINLWVGTSNSLNYVDLLGNTVVALAQKEELSKKLNLMSISDDEDEKFIPTTPVEDLTKSVHLSQDDYRKLIAK